MPFSSYSHKKKGQKVRIKLTSLSPPQSYTEKLEARVLSIYFVIDFLVCINQRAKLAGIKVM